MLSETTIGAIRTFGGRIANAARRAGSLAGLTGRDARDPQGVTIHLDADEVMEIARELNGGGSQELSEEVASELLKRHADRLTAVMRREAHYLIEELLVTSSG
jgi:hypothetical protein